MQKQSNCSLKKSAARSTRAPKQSDNQGLARQKSGRDGGLNGFLFCGPAHYAAEEISFRAMKAAFFARSASLESWEHWLKPVARIVNHQSKKQLFKWDLKNMGKILKVVPGFQRQSKTPPSRNAATIKKNDNRNDKPKVAKVANLPPKL